MQQLRNITMRDNKLIGYPEIVCQLLGLEHLNLAENRKVDARSLLFVRIVYMHVIGKENGFSFSARCGRCRFV